MPRQSRTRARTANSMSRSSLPAADITTACLATALSRSLCLRGDLMKRLLLCMMAFASVAWSQQNNNPERAMIERSNEVSGLDIDRFIGVAENSPVHLSHGTMLTHSILRAGDPYKPGNSGAVLEYRKDLAVATLLPRNRTPLST